MSDIAPSQDDLNELFDTVWTGYAQETLGPGTAQSSDAHFATQWSPPIFNTTNLYERADEPRHSPQPPTAKPARRPLPPTPGSTSASPQPPAFSPSPRASPRTFSADSYTFDSPSSAGRHLPATPGSSNSHGPSSTDSTSQTFGNLDRSSSFATSVNSMSRSSSLRPPGAGAPIVPGESRYTSSEESLGARDRKILDDTPEYTPPSSTFVQQNSNRRHSSSSRPISACRLD
ncbi:hypothetical protein BDZ89DRAFT_1049790 [Hymenopellis radicata]|nr:hypothetical protein BDZ89DRAFT_1049790 [Hymenopellis radicata]